MGIGGLGSAEVVDEDGDYLGFLGKVLDLVPRLLANVVVRHYEPDQEELQWLCHRYAAAAVSKLLKICT